MMRNVSYTGAMMSDSFEFFGLITWLALILFLVLGIIYFWREINKKEKK